MVYNFSMEKNKKMSKSEEKKVNGNAQPQVQEKEGVKIEPYKVFGKDISLTDPEIITYYKTRMKMMAIRFQLVGRVNNNGVYKISKDVKTDLVRMLKEIEDSDNDWYRASAVYMKKYYFFHVKLTMLDNDHARASLYLSEYVGDYFSEEYIVSHIADYDDIYDDEFRIKVRKVFNLVDVAVPMSDIQVPNLAVVIQDDLDLDLIVGGLYNVASQIYLSKILEVLCKTEKGKKILERYKELLSEKEEGISKEKHKYSSLKILLDKVIDENGGIEILASENQEIKNVVIEMNNSIKAINNLQNKTAAIEIMRPDKKNAQIKTAGIETLMPNSRVGRASSQSPVSGGAKRPASATTAPVQQGPSLFERLIGHQSMQAAQGIERDLEVFLRELQQLENEKEQRHNENREISRPEPESPIQESEINPSEENSDELILGDEEMNDVRDVELNKDDTEIIDVRDTELQLGSEEETQMLATDEKDIEKIEKPLNEELEDETNQNHEKNIDELNLGL